MLTKCPTCQTEYDLESGKYECECGTKFYVLDDGRVSVADQAPPQDMNWKTQAPGADRTMPPRMPHVPPEPTDPAFDEEKTKDKTIPPRRHKESDPADNATLPGKRDRKPDGRFEIGDQIMGRYKVLAELGRLGHVAEFSSYFSLPKIFS